MKEVGCVHLGPSPAAARPILSAAVKGVKSLYWDDLIFQYRLVTMQVEQLGPSPSASIHGTSLYDDIQRPKARKHPSPKSWKASRADREASGARAANTNLLFVAGWLVPARRP